MPRSRPPDADADRAARREVLLDAAVAVIRRDGPGASMEAMAREAGVTKPILYRRFGDRDGLVQALGARFAGDLSAVLDDALARTADPGRDPRDLLRSTIDAYVGLIERDPEIYRFLTERLGGGRGSMVGTLTQEIARGVAQVLGDQIRAAGGDSGAAEPWAHALVGMVHLAGDWWVERRTISRAALVDYLVALVWDGLDTLRRTATAPRAPGSA